MVAACSGSRSHPSGVFVWGVCASCRGRSAEPRRRRAGGLVGPTRLAVLLAGAQYWVSDRPGSAPLRPGTTWGRGGLVLPFPPSLLFRGRYVPVLFIRAPPHGFVLPIIRMPTPPVLRVSV